VLVTLNHDTVCAVSHKSNILVLSYNDYTLHIPCSIACIKFMLEFSLSDTPGEQGGVKLIEFIFENSYDVLKALDTCFVELLGANKTHKQ